MIQWMLPLGSLVICVLCFTSHKTAKIFPTTMVERVNFITGKVGRHYFLHIFINTHFMPSIFFNSNYIDPSGYKVVYHHGFNFYSLLTTNNKHLFHVLVSKCISSLEKGLFMNFMPMFETELCLFILTCKIFFIYSRYWTLIRHMGCVLSPIHVGCLFSFFILALKLKHLNFDEVQYISF